tara:strand:+ start:1118 stop:2074 length:957 start_codon:yes stop_codon:yes gene_type:complete
VGGCTKIINFKKGNVMKKITKQSNLFTLVQHYKESHDFKKLRDTTKRDYKVNLNRALITKVNDKTIANYKLKELSRSIFKQGYDEWLNKGIRTANYTLSVMRKVLNYGIELELITDNPAKGITRVKETGRKVIWTPEQVKLFLDHAYKEWETANIGLIVHMAYSFGQRIGDMRELQWSNIDFENKKLSLEQSKRRAEIHLPIYDENLLKMLWEQVERFGEISKYVAPSLVTNSSGYKPYTKVEICKHVNRIKRECGLPPELYASDMRRTAITEMIESGKDITSIMSVSGHQNPSSLKPYIKHTLKSATVALADRKDLW